MERFNQIERHYRENGRPCTTCGRSIIGGSSSLAKHMLTHAPPEERGTSSTSAKPEAALPEGIDIARVRQFLRSTPAKIRHQGGTFQKGELAGQPVAGLPDASDTSGRLKLKFNWVKDGSQLASPFKR